MVALDSFLHYYDRTFTRFDDFDFSAMSPVIDVWCTGP